MRARRRLARLSLQCVKLGRATRGAGGEARSVWPRGAVRRNEVRAGSVWLLEKQMHRLRGRGVVKGWRMVRKDFL